MDNQLIIELLLLEEEVEEDILDLQQMVVMEEI